MADHAAEVRASGGVEQLRDSGVAKGLLGDALDQVAELKGTVAAHDAELEKVPRVSETSSDGGRVRPSAQAISLTYGIICNTRAIYQGRTHTRHTRDTSVVTALRGRGAGNWILSFDRHDFDEFEINRS